MTSIAQGLDAVMVTAPDTARDSRRADRFEAQRVMWSRSVLERVQRCGSRTNGDGVQLRVSVGSDGRRHAGFGGLQTCGSVWACAVCSATVSAARCEEVRAACSRWMGDGGRIAMFTFTVKHARKDRCAEVWDAVQAGQHAITAGRAGMADKERFGVEVDRVLVSECAAQSCGEDSKRGRRHAGFCKLGTYARKYVLPWLRVVEVNVGENGWHVHQHALMFLPAGTTDDERDRLYAEQHGRWVEGAASAGLDGSLMVNAPIWVDSAEAIATYVTSLEAKGYSPATAQAVAVDKYSPAKAAAFEVTRGDLKAAARGNRSSMGLLADVVAYDRPKDRALWAEFEQASQGRRQMTWAFGARLILALGDEQSDDDLAAVETGTEADTVAVITPSSYYSVVARVPGRRAQLLEATERSTAEGLLLLEAWQVRWRVPLPTPTAVE